MNLIVNKLLHGLTLIKRSCQLAFANPILFVYGAVILTSGIGMMIRFDTMPVINIVYFLLVAAVNFFALACLCHHTMHILQQEMHGFKNTLVDVTMMAGKLSLWFVIGRLLLGWFVQFLMTSVDKVTPDVMMENIGYSLLVAAAVVVAVVVLTIIKFFTELVLPILATEENTGIITAIKRSYTIIMAYAMIFLSIFLTFSIACVICRFVPGLGAVVEFFRFLTYTVFYYEYYARPRPDLASTFYPDE